MKTIKIDFDTFNNELKAFLDRGLRIERYLSIIAGSECKEYNLSFDFDNRIVCSK